MDETERTIKGIIGLTAGIIAISHINSFFTKDESSIYKRFYKGIKYIINGEYPHE